MSLRLKLLLIALSTLALPWAGWQSVAQLAALLRQGQEQALLATAQGLERGLRVSGRALPAVGAAIVAVATEQPLAIDGYADDWVEIDAPIRRFALADSPDRLALRAAADARWLYLLIEVRDSTRVRQDASLALSGDHLALGFRSEDAPLRLRLANAAPGPLSSPLVDEDPDGRVTTLVGAWEEDASGYRVELKLPRPQGATRIDLEIFDAAPGLAPRAVGAAHLPLIEPPTELLADLQRLLPAGVRARIVSSEGYVLADAGTLAAPASEQLIRGVWADMVYRALVAPALTGAADLDGAQRQLGAAEVWQALSGKAATSWRESNYAGSVVLAAVLPMATDQSVAAALLVERSGAELVELTGSAVTSLMGASLLALLVAAFVLFVFASRLSIRIRRLRNAADRALQAEGRPEVRMPDTGKRDELGDLARSFGRLLDEVGAYTDYLRSLASKLSHELHTPLAIVKSSLDNLEHEAVPASARTYLARARDGAERLSALVRAMSEASRMERAIAAADAEDFDLTELVRGCVEGYRALAGARSIECIAPEQPLLLHGAPELIAQALDKLFDNALGFTPETGWIRISLSADCGSPEIRVANSGPLLPETMREHLFDSLVSVRDPGSTAADASPHLGLGLYIVRLVVERHGGTAAAANLADGSGVEFRLGLVGMPRQRS